MVLTERSVSGMQARDQREGRSARARNRWGTSEHLEVGSMREEMSLTESEPELGAIDAYELPHEDPPFPLVIRGYDRRSVDEYLEVTSARLNELEALQSPSVAVQEALERVATDTGSILKEAHETAEGVLTRAREEADRMVRQAREEADRTVASAEARVRQIGIDTDALWQERLRLIEDAQAVSASLGALAEEAAARFPAWEPDEEEDSGVVAAEAVDDIVEQPTEAFDVAEMLAAEEALPDGLEDLEPPPEFPR
jgi:cell division septum initiation protein DivIVA